MKELWSVWIPAVVAVGDLRIKNRIESDRQMPKEKPILKGRVILRHFHNPGAFLSLGREHGALVRLLSVVLTLAVAGLFGLSLTQKGNGLARTGYALLLGGAFSNTYDRLFRKYVVDYFSFHTGIGALDRMVFNLADFAVLIGAVCIVLGEGNAFMGEGQG